MCIQQLWQALDVYCHRTQVSLVDESMKEVVQNTAEVRGLRVGVDISIWISWSCYRHSKDAALRMISIHVMRIFSMTAIIPLFVFDGPARPHMKGRKQNHLRQSHYWLASKLKKLFSAAGFAWIEAPGQAAAELAWLCTDNWIDAVLTEGIDVMIFGAPRIFRMVHFSRSDITVYSYNDCQLSKEQLALVVVFRGGDYASGIPRCGIKTSIQLCYFVSSQQLLQAALSLDTDELDNFLQRWRINFRVELDNHPHKRVRDLIIPPNVPSARILHLYLLPVRSNPDTMDMLSWNTAPDLRRMAKVVITNLNSCRTFAKLFQHFDRLVFPGLAIRQLLKVQMELDDNLDADISPFHVIGSRAIPQKAQLFREKTHVFMNLSIPASIVLAIVTGGVDGGLEEEGYQPSTPTQNRRVKAWVPRILYEYVLAQPGSDISILAVQHDGDGTERLTDLPSNG